MRIEIIVSFLLCCIGYINAITPVSKCPQARSPEEYKQVITVGNCKKHPCRLRKGHTINVDFRFTPIAETKTVRNSVTATIAGLPFPFIGVDDTDACNNIFESDGTTQAKCPLQSGKEYVYKNHFDILPLYPIVKVEVSWALIGSDRQPVMCFTVPAKITN
ncbi:hypothetical protein RN001_000779 [Aquatica leii]|uniref:MD-2-related lipid-recognition domain-containing protein n=1 Tax=Aquatica leii TaxID=1421715 RepID=A0AAN7QM80_9COLE|nr:hypothetical protein RN001_000779 [Aquatica leii]